MGKIMFLYSYLGLSLVLVGFVLYTMWQSRKDQALLNRMIVLQLKMKEHAEHLKEHGYAYGDGCGGGPGSGSGHSIDNNKKLVPTKNLRDAFLDICCSDGDGSGRGSGSGEDSGTGAGSDPGSGTSTGYGDGSGYDDGSGHG